MNEILNPNCSEECFRLTGDLEDIKEEVLKMLDIIERDDGYKQDRKELIKKINNITNLKEFELIVFEFTCNYPTYFKKKGDDLLVATSNNYEWDDINSYPEDEDERDKIANENHYKLIFQDEKYAVAKETYADKPKLVFFEINGKINYDYDKSFTLIKKGRGFYITKDNELVEIKEIKDENLKNKLGILANL